MPALSCFLVFCCFQDHFSVCQGPERVSAAHRFILCWAPSVRVRVRVHMRVCFLSVSSRPAVSSTFTAPAVRHPLCLPDVVTSETELFACPWVRGTVVCIALYPQCMSGAVRGPVPPVSTAERKTRVVAAATAAMSRSLTRTLRLFFSLIGGNSLFVVFQLILLNRFLNCHLLFIKFPVQK